MNNLLGNIKILRKRMVDVSYPSYGIEGTIEFTSTEEAIFLKEIWTELRDCYYVNSKNDVDKESISLNTDIRISIDLRNVPEYYETVSSFINANKFGLKTTTFYIHSIDYHEGISTTNELIENFKLNLLVIDFIRNIADYKKSVSGNLELFFYKAEQGLTLQIEYGELELTFDFNGLEAKINELNDHFKNKTDASERRQIFVNELINLLKQKGATYSNFLKYWQEIIDNYTKSFSLYLAGFSYEKIKTSSIESFHELTDRIHSTIIKFSSYIFAVPIGYILLIRFLDFTGESLMKDLLLVFLGIVFFVLVWFVTFNSIDEAISAVERDIASFREKIKGDSALRDIRKELLLQEKKVIPKQKCKLNIARVVSVIILLLLLTAFISIYWHEIMKMIKNLLA